MSGPPLWRFRQRLPDGALFPAVIYQPHFPGVTKDAGRILEKLVHETKMGRPNPKKLDQLPGARHYKYLID